MGWLCPLHAVLVAAGGMTLNLVLWVAGVWLFTMTIVLVVWSGFWRGQRAADERDGENWRW